MPGAPLNRRRALARIRALRDLAKAHPAEFAALLAQHRDRLETERRELVGERA